MNTGICTASVPRALANRGHCFLATTAEDAIRQHKRCTHCNVEADSSHFLPPRPDVRLSTGSVVIHYRAGNGSQIAFACNGELTDAEWDEYSKGA